MDFRLVLKSELALLAQLVSATAGIPVKSLETYGTYEFDPYEEDSPRLFVVVCL